MKTYAFAVLMLLAGASALPTISEDELRQQRVITDTILGLIDGVSQAIQARGLDPYHLKFAESSFALSEPEILSGYAFARDVNLVGLSNIRVNNINFSILAQRLTIDLSLPNLRGSVGESHFEMNLFDRELDGQGSGSLEIVNLGLKADVRVSVGVISGITVRSIDLDLYLDNVVSDLQVNLFGRDLSASFNNFFNGLPAFVKENTVAINGLLEYIAWIIVERVLDN
ncbi:PREDICTED: uncharacterized protein LOC106114730 [Papilio xuthus]|uniref:Uncharacterized protein LOC106114730 n=1 Tax=Papilio xuthus TaxID=66420 RepID=A0A194PJU1_PAPXU|nr:PREDICTED: uncharacterized protein LOC106114730 [Papilio xuthus]KPI93587.1 hypothetical protein RR46_10847 [Papilio xuthus]